MTKEKKTILGQALEFAKYQVEQITNSEKELSKIKENQKSLVLFIQGLYDSCCEENKNNNYENTAEKNNNVILNQTLNNVYSNSLIGELENMKGITLRKDGRYMIRKCIDGQRIIRYAKTINEAKKIYTQLKNNKIVKKEKTKLYTLNSWIAEWLEIYKKPFIKSTTYDDIQSVMNIIKNEFKNILLNEITAQDIQKFINKYPKSRKKERIQTYFNALLQKAEDLSIIVKNPFKAVIRDKKGKWKRDCYTYEEQKAILNAIKGTDIEHEIYIYLMTGCRPNELPPKENFNFETNIITINGTKNENAKHREIEMSINFANYIKAYLNENEIKDEIYVRDKFKEICKSLKIHNPLLYRLRHTFASNHFTLGTNTKYVQTWLGHYSVSITLDQYTDIDKTATKEKIRELYNNFYFETN